ncbi:MAG: hypothetical protein ACYDH9_23195 [Limisphaerales bacterium]
MSMDSQPSLPEPASRPPKRKRSVTLQLVGVVVGALSLGAILLFALAPAPNPKMAWLAPTELAQATHVGPITRLRYRVMNLTAPLWRWYWNRKPRISVRATLRTLDPWSAERTGLGTPIATNSAGMRAWILTPAKASLWQQRLKSVPGSFTFGTSAGTSEGTPASASIGEGVPGNRITINLTPRVTAGSVKLVFNFTSVYLALSSSGNPTVVLTNFTTSCRVLVPNTGSLVINQAQARTRNGESYWLVISPTATDARGNLIKP